MHEFSVPIGKNIQEFTYTNLSTSAIILKEKTSRAMKGIGVIRKFNEALPQHSLITIT